MIVDVIPYNNTYVHIILFTIYHIIYSYIYLGSCPPDFLAVCSVNSFPMTTCP